MSLTTKRDEKRKYVTPDSSPDLPLSELAKKLRFASPKSATYDENMDPCQNLQCKEMQQRIDDLERKVMEKDIIIDQLSLKVSALETAITNISTNLAATISAAVTQAVQECMKGFSDMLGEKEAKQANRRCLVISGLVELDNSSDQKIVTEQLLPAIVGSELPPSIISSAIINRMGKPNNDSRPRLTKLIMLDTFSRDIVFGSARRLKGNDQFGGVYLRPSLTKNQHADQDTIYRKIQSEKILGSFNRSVIHYRSDGTPFEFVIQNRPPGIVQ